MADFNYYLNRVGVRGPKGEQGEQGFSPIITVATDTLSEYILQIQTQNNTFLTANLREHKDDLGGTYIRYNRETGVMYAGEADTATTQNLGEVRFATATELERNDGSTVVTPADVNTLIDARDYDTELTRLEGSIQANRSLIDSNTAAIGINTADIRTLRENVWNIDTRVSSVEGNYVTTNTTQNVPGTKTFNIIRLTPTYGGIEIPYRGVDYNVLSATEGQNNTLVSVIGNNYNGNRTQILGSYIDFFTSDGRLPRTYRNSQYYDIVDAGSIENYLPNMNNYYTVTQTDLLLNEKADISDIPTVGNGTITFTQGGVTKGTITTNQSGNATIALDAGGGASYTEGPGINIDNDEISVDDTVVALKSDIPDVSNMVTTDTNQTISGIKTFNQLTTNYLDVDTTLHTPTITSRASDTSMGLLFGSNGGTIIFGNKYSTIRKVYLGNQTDFDNIVDDSVNGIVDKNGNTYLTSSSISTNAYIQALEARIAALEANINGGNAASA